MKKKVQKLIEENFAPNEVFNDNEEEFTVGSSLNILDDKIEEFPADVGTGLFAFKSRVFPGDVLSEPATKRAKVVSEGKDFFDSPSEYESSNEGSDVDEDDSDLNSGDHISDSAVSERDSAEDGSNNNDSDGDNEHVTDDSENEADEGDDSSNIDESDIEDDMNATEVDDFSEVFSKKILDQSSELQKANAVTNQLALWDNLLESRILLQKCIVETNELPRDYSPSEASPEVKNSIESLEKCLAKLVEVQEKLRRETTKQENIGEEDYASFRNKTIETWYNRTRGARSNFSAFETPLLKQIEKADLVKKTYLPRTEPTGNWNEISSEDSSVQVDTETIADDDYYHKLLRNYIRRKTANISDSTQLGRQWMQLQNARSKVKRKIDARRTKGRKIKLDPHTKLMNFMAPQTSGKWEDESINELYASVFGKRERKTDKFADKATDDDEMNF